MDKQIQNVKKDMEFLANVYKKLISILPAFDITNKKILPYGLKPHTRSVSWLVEQVINQQTKFNAKKLGLTEVNFDMPDTCLHDCELRINEKIYYINIKIHNVDAKENKNDISAVEKLYMQYSANPSYNLIYACFGIHFHDINIRFNREYINIFSPQFLPIYVNPRNDKIQAYYEHELEYRSRKKFLQLLRTNSKSIVLNK